MMRLKDKVAIVTGSTSGIGLATAKLFAKEGAKVVLAARKEDVANEIVREIKADGGEAMFVHLEVSDPKEWEDAAKKTMETYGALNILVNNAGVNTPVAFPRIDIDAWNKVMDIDVTGPMVGIQTCAPYMRTSGGGSIINIASLGGMFGTVSTAYSTAKWALRGLSACAAASYGTWGIRSNVVDPGFIAGTNLTNKIQQEQAANNIPSNPLADLSSLERAGTTDELANAVLFLASDESSYVTGVEIPVDGGLNAGGIYAVARKQLQQMMAKMSEAK